MNPGNRFWSASSPAGVEYTAVLLFAFSLLAGIAGGSPIKGLIAIFLGVFLLLTVVILARAARRA